MTSTWADEITAAVVVSAMSFAQRFVTLEHGHAAAKMLSTSLKEVRT